MKSYILAKNFEHRYNKAFQEYAIRVFYGDDVLYGSDLVQDEDTVVADVDEVALQDRGDE